MKTHADQNQDDNGVADAMATVAIITIVVVAMYLWLSGMPG